MTRSADRTGFALDSVLIANRGEIAVRIIRTLRRLGIRSIAVFSDADIDARHVAEADEAIRLGPAPAAESYLNIDAILAAAATAGAKAIHPGYGFLSENAVFAEAVRTAGLVFVGPPAAAIDAMGDKVRAKRTVEAAGVPVVPGRHELEMTDEQLVDAAGEIGYPVLLKPSAGGGGKGMRRVFEPAKLSDEIGTARREARAAFGDDTLLVERLVSTPRHIEIQVLADEHGSVVHLGERECSLQRRHQKIIEEAPSPLLTPSVREKMGAAAVEAARAVGYTGVGTIEFIMSADVPDEFFFMEMNTRLQVEHPVTEMVTGWDLVEWQLRVAAGERLPANLAAVPLSGHAVEARVYAENPASGFLPTGGTVLRLAEPSDMDGVRTDSGLSAGMVVGSDYDPMLAKVIAVADDRAAALRRLDRALAATAVLGVGTNIDFLRRLLAVEDVAAGRLDTELIDRRLADLTDDVVPAEILAAAAMRELLLAEPTTAIRDPFDLPGGWRLGEPSWRHWLIVPDGAGSAAEAADVRAAGRAAGARVAVGDAEPMEASARWLVEGESMAMTYGGRTSSYTVAEAGGVVWLHSGEHGTWALRERGPLAQARTDAAVAGGPLVAPMPGTVAAVDAVVGQRVAAGERLAVVEAMKMEHPIVAPYDGIVAVVAVDAGQSVAIGAELITVTPAEQAAD